MSLRHRVIAVLAGLVAGAVAGCGGGSGAGGPGFGDGSSSSGGGAGGASSSGGESSGSSGRPSAAGASSGGGAGSSGGTASSGAPGGSGSSGDGGGSGAAADAGAAGSSDGSARVDAGASGGADGGGGRSDAGAVMSDGGCGRTPKAGNANGSCSTGVPAAGQPANVANPTAVIGAGTPASCTFAALSAAVSAGGVITFDCGCAPVTIPVTSTMKLPTNKNTVIDGGNRIVLDGGGAVQILSFSSSNYRANETRVTIQHITMINAKTNPVDMIPPASQAACSQGFDDGQGGAIYMRDGNLTVIDSIFQNDHAAPVGPDTGGGAIYVTGSKHGVLVVGSTFEDNSGSNAGAVGALNSELDVYDSSFTGNSATGHDANSNDPSACSAMNNGQNEVGSGGNGGALYLDGDSVNVVVCGDEITGNAAGKYAFAGGVFMTSDDLQGTLTITDSTITGNTGGSWGGAGTAIGVNAASITITNSTVQGYP